MSTYSIEVEPLATTAVTGRLGAAIVEYRGRAYRVVLGGREHTCDGRPCSLNTLPPAVFNYATKMHGMLRDEYLRRVAL